MLKLLSLAGVLAVALAHDSHDHEQIIAGPHQGLWFTTLPGDGGTQVCSCTFVCKSLAEIVYRRTLYSRVSRPLVVCLITIA